MWVGSFLQVAAKAADRAEDQAARAATKRFADWIADGPANGLRRQHLFSRCATGWVADQADEQVGTNLSELDDLEGISQEQLKAALAPSNADGTPVGAQYAANVEKVNWGIQWDVDACPDQLVWPDETDTLEPISLSQFRQALFTFPAGTGLG